MLSHLHFPLDSTLFPPPPPPILTCLYIAAVAVQPDKPFRGLEMFGGGFLSKFQASECNAPLLEEITFIDTPGVQAGEKQRSGRGYDFTQVASWFAERADLILLLFDCHKLDISDEFKKTIECLRVHCHHIYTHAYPFPRAPQPPRFCPCSSCWDSGTSLCILS